MAYTAASEQKWTTRCHGHIFCLQMFVLVVLTKAGTYLIIDPCGIHRVLLNLKELLCNGISCVLTA
ncbi:hypothetical protein BYT27DRAFT_7204977 [Phlegmacium glaucopus]|nr:hypothetical protein BYT27DRAFT_7204977 [Phlegmacium glaucopus]